MKALTEGRAPDQDKALQMDGEVLDLDSAIMQKVAQPIRDSQKALMPHTGLVRVGLEMGLVL